MERTLGPAPFARRPSPAELRALLAWPLRALVRNRHARRRTAAGLLSAGVLVAGWLAVRDSPLVSVDHVRISGVHGVEGSQIRSALRRVGRRMTTLDVNLGALRAAVARFPVVRDLRVSTGFPHTLRIKVIEQLPAAALAVGAQRTAVAGDGVVLGPGLATSRTPVIAVGALPGRRVRDRLLLAELSVIGSAPGPLARRAARVYRGPAGIAVATRNGPVIIFGQAVHLHAKWTAAARVLADSSSRGAAYVDVRFPERPAAGGLSSATSALSGQATASDPTAAALAAELAGAVSGSAPTGGAAPTGPAGTSGVSGTTPAGAGPTGAAATGTAPTGTAGTGTAGTGTAGSGTAGSATAGSATSGAPAGTGASGPGPSAAGTAGQYSTSTGG